MNHLLRQTLLTKIINSTSRQRKSTQHPCDGSLSYHFCTVQQSKHQPGCYNTAYPTRPCDLPTNAAHLVTLRWRYLHYRTLSFMINTGKRTEWSPIWSVIIQVITKSDDREAGVQFVNHECHCRPTSDDTKSIYQLIIKIKDYIVREVQNTKTKTH